MHFKCFVFPSFTEQNLGFLSYPPSCLSKHEGESSGTIGNGILQHDFNVMTLFL